MSDGAGVRAFSICHRLRCQVTGHPVGTDTWPGGYWCPCDACQTVLALRNVLAATPAGDAVERALAEAVLKIQPVNRPNSHCEFCEGSLAAYQHYMGHDDDCVVLLADRVLAARREGGCTTSPSRRGGGRG